jgi:outer membrane cobalamin receptor
MSLLYRLILFSFGVFYITSSFGQTDINNITIVIPARHELKSKKDYLDFITDRYGWTFSYNANQVDVTGTIKLDYQISNLRLVLEQLFDNDEIAFIVLPSKKIILQVKPPKLKEYSISGIVTDKWSGESIFGAVIFDHKSGRQVLTNEKGYYIMRLPEGESKLEVNYIAYKRQITPIQIKAAMTLNVSLENENLIDTIRIKNPKSRIQLVDGGHFIDVFKTKEFNSIIGEKDIINNARILPGVQSGGEGMAGLFVRGGTPDQNLILLEGVSLYETSHLAGISSIFMDESIKEVSFIRNGFPARYGGRLSSVMDVILKEGDKNKHNINITAGLSGAKFHFDGPIVNEKTTYSLTARTSWVNFYINNLLKKYTKYDNIIVQYHDILGKVTRHFSPSNSISFTLYQGSDRLQLDKSSSLIDSENPTQILNVLDNNGLKWGNIMSSIKWNVLLSSKISLKVQAGVLKYSNGTRSSYTFESINATGSKTDALDVITSSNITDYNVRADADYFVHDKHTIRAGFNYIKQHFNPTVRQSTVILQGNQENIVDQDSVIKANLFQTYIEDNFRLHKNLSIYGGFHFSTYTQASKTYSSLQPRLKAMWTPFEKHMLTAAFSSMTQYIHLLSNSGLGLPSDLWVPSTPLIAPQQSLQWSGNYTYNLTKSAYINLGYYTKKLDNQLEYTTPIEMFYFLINEQNVVPVYNTARDWERNVIKGSGKSEGVELLLHKSEGNTKGWMSLTKSKTYKTFKDINNGLAFPANHDKTWDLSVGLIHKFSNSFSMGANFVYNTGNAFSLATEEYDSYEGIKLLNSTGRNNYRLPDFHQLSINAVYKTKKDKTDISYSLNLYNVYNRLNAYYIYIYQNNKPPYERLLKKVSILPFTPTFNISVSF